MGKRFTYIIGALVIVLSFFQFGTILNLVNEITNYGGNAMLTAGIVALPTLLIGIALMAVVEEK